MYPFSKKETYFSENQLRAFNEFLKVEPRVEMDYTNDKGETRHVLFVRYPTGAITNETQWHMNRVHYITERATVDGNRESFVYYMDGGRGGKHARCTQSEWIEWAGEDYKAIEASHDLVVDPYAAGREAIKAQHGIAERQFTEEAVAEKKATPKKQKKADAK